MHKGNLFSSISFVDGKENSGKGLNPRPLGCKVDSNHCISFFPLKTMYKNKYFNHSSLYETNKFYFIFLLGIILYGTIIMSSLVLHLIRCYYLMFAR